MKKHYLAFVALAAAAVATSCSTDELAQLQKQNQTEPQTVTLTASVDSSNDVTRVGMKKESSTVASFYWHKDDKIFVQTVNNETYGGAEFTTTAENGATSATFTGEVTGTVGQYAVYPSGSHTFTGENTLTYNLPASYDEYTPESKIFGTTGDYPSNSTNMPMLGTITENTISFKSIGGLAVIRIDKMPVAEGTLTVTADQQLCGDFTVADLSASGAQIKTTTASDGNGKVTFTFSGADVDGVGVFYLPLATGDYTHVKFEIKDKGSDTWWMYSCSGTLSIARAGGTAVPLSADKMGCAKKNYDGTYTVNNHKFIDLGLSVLWAETNIGATNCWDYGSYFAWGETATKSKYDWDTYNHGTSTDNLTKYNSSDNKTVLDKEDDAATVNWGEGVRMPTKAEQDELKGCDWNWASYNNVNCGWVKGKKEGYTNNSICLPAAGGYAGVAASSIGQDVIYWSSEISFSGYACVILFQSEKGLSNSAFPRSWGLPVRAVAEKPITTE